MVTSKSVVPSNSRPRGDGFTELFLDEQLCFTLYATSLAMTKVYRPLLTPLGLTYPQYVVMLALWQHGEMTAGSLGEQVAGGGNPDVLALHEPDPEPSANGVYSPVTTAVAARPC